MKLKDLLEIGGACALSAALILGAAALIGGLCLLPSAIAWLLWNHAIAPAFGAPHAGFWLVFAILWVLGIVGRLFSR